MKTQLRILGSNAKPQTLQRRGRLRSLLVMGSLLGSVLLNACGQKGPLYLPTPASAAAAAAPASSPPTPATTP